MSPLPKRSPATRSLAGTECSFVLSDEEIRELTGKKHRAAQVRVLNALGVEHRLRPDGSIVVLAAHIEQLLGVTKPATVPVPHEPDFAALAKAS